MKTLKYEDIEIKRKRIEKILSRNTEKIIEEKSLRKKLLKGKKIRVKYGIDPTGPKIHIGQASVLWKLKKFQDLGHKIVLILGDCTAQIGDPSDKLYKRPFLSANEVKKNLKEYKKQISQILNIKKVEWRRNSEWLGKLKPRELDELADLFSVQQMLARRNFKERWKNKEEISIRELHYPLYQGYDSVMVKADLEIGGNDQLFNLLAGRKIQQFYRQSPQDIMTIEMLEGLDGNKMSASQGNVVNISDVPLEQFGKIMSMKDELIVKYFQLCTLLPVEKIKEIEKQLKQGLNPRDAKAKLAFEIVKLYHGEKKAEKARQGFDRVFKEKKNPKDIRVVKINKKKVNLIDLLEKSQTVKSRTEARRLIEQGAVKVDQKVVNDWQADIDIKDNLVAKVGKRRFFKIKKY